MCKDYIPIQMNGLSLEKAYNKLFSKTWRITEASEEKFFYRIPKITEIREIEIGDKRTTRESILRLKDGGFVVVNKIFDIKELEEEAVYC